MGHPVTCLSVVVVVTFSMTVIPYVSFPHSDFPKPISRYRLVASDVFWRWDALYTLPVHFYDYSYSDQPDKIGSQQYYYYIKGTAILHQNQEGFNRGPAVSSVSTGKEIYPSNCGIVSSLKDNFL